MSRTTIVLVAAGCMAGTALYGLLSAVSAEPRVARRSVIRSGAAGAPGTPRHHSAFEPGHTGGRGEPRGDEPDRSPTDGEPGEAAPRSGGPHWLIRYFTPRPGEDMWGYRDRVLPLVQDALIPQRNRVARFRDEFISAAELSDHQQRELDRIVDDTAARVSDRVLQGVLSGELLPRNLKASTGVAFARDILEELDGSNRRFVELLDDDQKQMLAGSPFDVVDYLVFSTRWEQRLGLTW